MTSEAGGGWNGDGPRNEPKPTMTASIGRPPRRRRPLRNRVRGFVQRYYFSSILIVSLLTAAVLYLWRTLAAAYLRTG
ncbi:hypothetical protein GCM10023232_01850 [Sphingosinicella ginsenosidimutans]